MPVNNWDSNLRVETNVNGVVKDNEEWVAERAKLEHQTTAVEPWSQGYIPPEEVQAKIDALYEEFSPVEAPEELLDANKKDLKIRNLDR